MAGSDTTPDDLATRLREAGEEELEELLERHLDELGVPEVRQALRNPFLSRRGIERLLSRQGLLTAYEVRWGIARHRNTPEARALQLVPGLYWRELVRLGRDPRVRPLVRRAAERRLSQRLPVLTAGEKISIARRCGAAVIGQLRHDRDPRVVGALLDNPRLTEGLLSPLAASEAAPPPVLRLIASHRRWGCRRNLRLALCRNRRTPGATALGILPHLPKHDLRLVATDRRVHARIRQRAELLLGR